ncbi:hypothetical protein JW777_00700 [bacterium]|nr:hypothetical protein [bacterium]
MAGGSEKIDAMVKILDDFLTQVRTQDRLNAVGLSIIRIIKTRTRSWRDVDGSRFEDYSAAYKRKRVASNLAVTPKGKNTDSMLVWDPIDGMMQHIDAIVSSDLKSVVADITSAEKKKLAYYHSEGGVGRKGAHIRKFWGLSGPECDLLAKKFTTDAGDILGGIVEMAQLKVD